MSEFIVAILQPLLSIPAQYLVNPIKNQLSYLCCYNSNAQKLSHEDKNLDIARQKVEEQVHVAERNLEAIQPDVADWLTRAIDIQTTSRRVLRDADNIRKRPLSKCCPFLHYSLSREAKKTTDSSVELQNSGRFERVSNPVNPADLESIPTTSEPRLESRESVEKEIMEALKDNKVYLIGLCGMGGVGKTTMINKIMTRMREKRQNSGPMCEEVVMADVSQKPDLSKIQREMAEGLGFKLEETSLKIRARRLHARFKVAKSVLIIFDDVWERLNLEEIGIPSQSTHPGCKLILASRNRNALTLTEDAKIFSLQVLTEEEAWIFFRKQAGVTSIDSPGISSIAKEVTKECGGLPLALVTVGWALSGKNECYYWKDALRGLQQSIPTNIPDVLQYVYRPLRWSYDQLENNKEARDLFLLCCLFPENSNICLEILVKYGKGLGIFAGIDNLSQARDRVRSIVDDLISRSLLINGRDWKGDRFVKMHDIIRDMAIWIASESEHVFMISHGKLYWPKPKEASDLDNYKCISLLFTHREITVPERINYPRLEFLLMNFYEKEAEEAEEEEDAEIPENFFDGMRALRVLDASFIGQLPLSSVHLLKNLQTLRLRKCKLKKTSIIGELMNLEILSLTSCVFEELPEEIGGLKNLMILEIKACRQLQRIAAGVLSRLVQLEELVILESFKNWGAETKTNASLAELNSLSHLTALQIEIGDPNVIPEKLSVLKLEKYCIFVEPDSQSIDVSEFQKSIVLKCDEVMQTRAWFSSLARDSEYLDLDGHGCTSVFSELVGSEYHNMKHLRLHNCINTKYLIYEFDGVPQINGAIFPVLETLKIERSDKLQKFWDVPPRVGSFVALKTLRLEQLSGLTHLWTSPNEKLCLPNLERIEINYCGSLLYLFPLSTAQTLSQLEQLQIRNCQAMEEIFKMEEGGMDKTVNAFLPKLRAITLEDLPKFRGFCKGVRGIEFPVLGSLSFRSSTRTVVGGI